MPIIPDLVSALQLMDPKLRERVLLCNYLDPLAELTGAVSPQEQRSHASANSPAISAGAGDEQGGRRGRQASDVIGQLRSTRSALHFR